MVSGNVLLRFVVKCPSRRVGSEGDERRRLNEDVAKRIIGESLPTSPALVICLSISSVIVRYTPQVVTRRTAPDSFSGAYSLHFPSFRFSACPSFLPLPCFPALFSYFFAFLFSLVYSILFPQIHLRGRQSTKLLWQGA